MGLEGIILLLSAGKWSSPPTTGPRPPPCYFFSFTAINDHQAVLFAGKQPRRRRVNDCFLMDFESMVCPERYCNDSVIIHHTTVNEWIIWALSKFRFSLSRSTLSKSTLTRSILVRSILLRSTQIFSRSTHKFLCASFWVIFHCFWTTKVVIQTTETSSGFVSLFASPIFTSWALLCSSF